MSAATNADVPGLPADLRSRMESVLRQYSQQALFALAVRFGVVRPGDRLPRSTSDLIKALVQRLENPDSIRARLEGLNEVQLRVLEMAVRAGGYADAPGLLSEAVRLVVPQVPKEQQAPPKGTRHGAIRVGGERPGVPEPWRPRVERRWAAGGGSGYRVPVGGEPPSETARRAQAGAHILELYRRGLLWPYPEPGRSKPFELADDWRARLPGLEVWVHPFVVGWLGGTPARGAAAGGRSGSVADHSPRRVVGDGPGVLVHDVYALLAFLKAGPVGLTQKGRLPVRVAGHLLSRLAGPPPGWAGDWVDFILELSRSAGLFEVAVIRRKNGVAGKTEPFVGLRPSLAGERWMQGSRPQQLSVLFEAWRKMGGLDDALLAQGLQVDYSEASHALVTRTTIELQQARDAVLGRLVALGAGRWVPFHVLSSSLRQSRPGFLVPRVDDTDGLGASWPYRGLLVRNSDGQWRPVDPGAGLDTAWREVEERYVASLLLGPLLAFGVVQVDWDGRAARPEGFIVTPAGRALLEGREPPEADLAPGGGAAAGGDHRLPPAVRVLPTGDIYVETGRVPPADLEALRRCCELLQADRITHLRLSEEAALAGLEAGITPDQIRALLQRLAGDQLPSTVASRLSDWEQAARRVAVEEAVTIVESPQLPVEDLGGTQGARQSRQPPPARHASALQGVDYDHLPASIQVRLEAGVLELQLAGPLDWELARLMSWLNARPVGYRAGGGGPDAAAVPCPEQVQVWRATLAEVAARWSGGTTEPGPGTPPARRRSRRREDLSGGVAAPGHSQPDPLFPIDVNGFPSPPKGPRFAQAVLETLDRRTGGRVPAEVRLAVRTWLGGLGLGISDAFILWAPDEQAMRDLLALPEARQALVVQRDTLTAVFAREASDALVARLAGDFGLREIHRKGSRGHDETA